MNQGFVLKRGETISIFLPQDECAAVRRAAGNLCTDLWNSCGVHARLTGDPAAKIAILPAEAERCPELREETGALHWEGFSLTVEQGRLLIRGVERRGRVYGIYELSRMLGVSPWCFFADVPVKQRDRFALDEGFQRADWPSVRYRGVFINDEEELEAWAIAKMGETTIGPRTYEKIYELLLRLRANYLWPAMHVNAFNHDPENGRLAHEMGLVIGTSHCDMLLRSNQNEWKPWVAQKGYDGAEYDYSIPGRNREIIREYWRECLEQNRAYEVSYTVGMRGIHDSGFITREITGSPEEQRRKKVALLEQVIRDQQELIAQVTGKTDAPQTFIPYKEVLDLYDAGLQVPENVTLIWVNDNFAYMRRYPNEAERRRPGGNGLYFHASYWAHPGMSYLFFNSTPLAHTKNELKKAYENGIQQMWTLNVGAIKPLEADIEFFLRYAWEIGREEPTTADVRVFLQGWADELFSGGIGQDLAEIYTQFSQLTNVRKPEHMRPGLFSHTAFGNEAARRMERYASLFRRTAALQQSLPEAERESFFQLFAMKIYAASLINASFYYGDRSAVRYRAGQFAGAETDVDRSRRMDALKRRLLHYYNKTMSGGKWDRILTPEQFLPPCTALYPAGKPALVLRGEDPAEAPPAAPVPLWTQGRGFCENDGVVSMAAAHFEQGSGWTELPDLGYGEGSLMQAEGGSLVYRFSVASGGRFLLELYRFPTLNSTGRIRVGVRIDGGALHVLESDATDEWRGSWRENVLHGVEKMYLTLPELAAGEHTLTLETIDRYVAVSKLVLYTSGYRPSYLGPQESYHPRWNPDPDRTMHHWDCRIAEVESICEQLFPGGPAPLPEVIYGDKAFWQKERLYLKNETVAQTALGAPRYGCSEAGVKNVFEAFGRGVICEKNGVLAFGTELALEESEYAWRTPGEDGSLWEHTHSETDGQTGIAMLVEGPDRFWTEGEKAPGLHYRVRCSEGRYSVWALVKYDDECYAQCAFAIDGQEIPQRRMFGGGHLFNYGTQQNWVWLILTEAELSAGEHVFSVLARAPWFRVDRLYLTKGGERPPIDCGWEESERTELAKQEGECL